MALELVFQNLVTSDASNILGPLIFAAGRGQCIAMCNTLRILVCLSNHLTLSVPDEGYPRNVLCALN